MKRIYFVASVAMLLVACSGSDGQRADAGGERLLAASTVVAGEQVALRGYRANYALTTDGGNVTVLDRISGRSTTYASLKTLAFFDAQTAFGTDSGEASLYRLYQAAFNRKPDAAGLGFWIAAYRSGYSLQAIAAQFIASDEFAAMYGKDPSAENFVMAAYTNVLRRAPEESGYQWWVNAVKSGVPRADVLLGFADSAENRDLLAPDMKNGFDFVVPRKPGEPIVPQASSYLNKNNIPVETTALPGVADPSMSAIREAQQKDGTIVGFNPRSLSLADFFRDGTITMFVTAPRYTKAYPNDNPLHWGDSPSISYFLRKGSDGKWTDATSLLIKDPADRYTCVTTSYSIVADFNNDGAPDIYLPCTGIDFTVGGEWTDAQNSEQHLYLSQPDGTYKHSVLPIGRAYGHQATAADFDGNGTVDIVSVDRTVRGRPFVLWGRGDGTFVEDDARMPSDMQGKDINGVVAVPIGGKPHVVVSGLTPNSWKPGDPRGAYFGGVAYGTKVLVYNGSRFEYTRDLTPTIPATAAGPAYSAALDHIFYNNALYSLRVDLDYTAQVITKTDWNTGATTKAWELDKADFGKVLDQIGLVNGYLMQFGAACNQYDATVQFACAYRIKP
jgi:hypothetical protein